MKTHGRDWTRRGGILGTFVLFAAGSVGAATFTVTDVSDSGAGTLRQAILDANAAAGLDTIAFNLPGDAPFLLQPTSALPTVTEQVTIDGSTQPGFAGVPVVVLDGSVAGMSVDGLRIEALTFVTIRSLVVSRWGGTGIFFDGRTLALSAGHVVEGCYVGTDPTGTMAWPNGGEGIRTLDCDQVRVGGPGAGQGNLISGNRSDGLQVSVDTKASVSGVVVQGNLFGVDVTGSQALPNFGSNLVMDFVGDSLVGGPTAAERNVLAASGGYGILMVGGIGNLVQNNYIGTDASGTVALPNTLAGVLVGLDTSVLDGNLISGNSIPGSAGVVLAANSATHLRNNRIGTDSSGNLALGNAVGLRVQQNGGGSLGSGNLAEGNVIAGNLGHGVLVDRAGSTGFLIEGNWIGLSAAGLPLGNGESGLFLLRGGASSISGNVVAGNARYGIEILSSTAIGSTITDNFIGTDAAGTAGLGNLVGGVLVDRAPGLFIGLPGHGNVIAGNGSTGAGGGVRIEGAGASGNVVQGNFIGVLADGVTVLGNRGHGVRISVAASSNQIGGVEAGEANVIAGNSGAGVALKGGVGNLVSGNSSFGNGELGLDLGVAGVDPNDPGDGDGGVNQGQNYPVLTAVTADPTITIVEGTLDSLPATDFVVEVFVSTVCDPSGHGEGEAYLGSLAVATDGAGMGTFTALVPATNAGLFASATATDPVGNTSEHSACVEVVAGTCPFCILLDGFESGDTSRWSGTLRE